MAEGQLGEREAAALRAHLDRCESCRLAADLLFAPLAPSGPAWPACQELALGV